MCRLLSFVPGVPERAVCGLLVNMNQVFQDFVEVALTEALAPLSIGLRGQDARHRRLRALEHTAVLGTMSSDLYRASAARRCR